MTLPTPIRPSDPQTFTYLYNRFFEEVYAYARKAGEADGFDYVHDAFAYLYSHDKEFPDVEKVRNFIIKCVRRKAINKHQHRIEEVTDEYELIEDETIAAVEGVLMGNMLRLFELLPKDTKKTLELRFYKGLKAKEIAVILGVSEFTVRTQWSYGLNKLRQWHRSPPMDKIKRMEALRTARKIVKEIGVDEFGRITGDKVFAKNLFGMGISGLTTQRILNNIQKYLKSKQ